MNRRRALRVAGLAARALANEEEAEAETDAEELEEEDETTASAARASTASFSCSGARIPAALEATTSSAATTRRQRKELSSSASCPRNFSTAPTEAFRGAGGRGRGRSSAGVGGAEVASMSVGSPEISPSSNRWSPILLRGELGELPIPRRRPLACGTTRRLREEEEDEEEDDDDEGKVDSGGSGDSRRRRSSALGRHRAVVCCCRTAEGLPLAIMDAARIATHRRERPSAPPVTRRFFEEIGEKQSNKC